MNWIALRMLTGDRSKYLGLIFGVTFATLLMTQQVSIFMGILTRTGNQILEVRDADIWVMDNRVRYLDEAPGLQDTDLMRVRGVPGVAWAVRSYKGIVRARLEDGNTRNVRLTGLDDESLVGAPQEMAAGSVEDLKLPDAVIIDTAGYEYMWGKESYKIGRTFQLNDRRAVLVGVCKVGAPFVSDPIVFARYSLAAHFVPRERNLMNYILVKPKEGVDQLELCRRIEEQTGRMALTQREFFWKTVTYFLASTGIPVNFGITIALGFIVGAAVTGQTLYLFIVESLKQFGALKAMGIPNRGILRMILLQALLVGCVGYGLGVGLTTIFFITTGNFTHLAGLHMTWPAFLGTGAAVVVIVIATSIIQRAARADARTGNRLPRMKGTHNMIATAERLDRPPASNRVLQTAVFCQGVTKEFGVNGTKTFALRGVDVDVYDGQLTLLVGPSGCGKTTLISIVAGLLNPTRGSVAVWNTDLSKLSGRGLVEFRAKNIGFVFQQYNLLPALSAVENAAVPLIIAGWPRAKAITKARKMLATVGLDERADNFPSQLSGGEQQRVAIARALIHEPRLLVCDEPTSALDAKSGQTVMELVKQVAVESGRAVIVVTHDSRVYEFGDRIIEMSDGRISAGGEP